MIAPADMLAHSAPWANTLFISSILSNQYSFGFEPKYKGGRLSSMKDQLPWEFFGILDLQSFLNHHGTFSFKVGKVVGQNIFHIMIISN